MLNNPWIAICRIVNLVSCARVPTRPSVNPPDTTAALTNQPTWRTKSAIDVLIIRLMY
ncbi:hypothetical protein AB0M44_08235 [Streptosporangium subroseum]|uniref:hypothetical protein n=1 Tax=Streptosporangium subroseum TaxID=106412 RepID=UPI0034426CB4